MTKIPQLFSQALLIAGFKSRISTSQILWSESMNILPSFSHKSSPHQNPTFGPTFYKFIVMGPLDLDPVCRWARSENRDPTVTIIGNIILYFSIFFDLWSASHSFFPRPTFLFIYFLFYEHSFLFLLQYYYQWRSQNSSLGGARLKDNN